MTGKPGRPKSPCKKCGGTERYAGGHCVPCNKTYHRKYRIAWVKKRKQQEEIAACSRQEGAIARLIKALANCPRDEAISIIASRISLDELEKLAELQDMR